MERSSWCCHDEVNPAGQRGVQARRDFSFPKGISPLTGNVQCVHPALVPWSDAGGILQPPQGCAQHKRLGKAPGSAKRVRKREELRWKPLKPKQQELKALPCSG